MSRTILEDVLKTHPAPWTLEGMAIRNGEAQIVKLSDANKVVIACNGAVPGVWSLSAELMAAFAILVNQYQQVPP
jgi:hypothetical protein